MNSRKPNETWLLEELAELGTAFGEKLSSERLELYARTLAARDRKALDYAFQRALKELHFFPKVAQLLDFAYQYQPAGKRERFVACGLNGCMDGWVHIPAKEGEYPAIGHVKRCQCFEQYKQGRR